MTSNQIDSRICRIENGIIHSHGQIFIEYQPKFSERSCWIIDFVLGLLRQHSTGRGRFRPVCLPLDFFRLFLNSGCPKLGEEMRICSVESGFWVASSQNGWFCQRDSKSDQVPSRIIQCRHDEAEEGAKLGNVDVGRWSCDHVHSPTEKMRRACSGIWHTV